MSYDQCCSSALSIARLTVILHEDYSGICATVDQAVLQIEVFVAHARPHLTPSHQCWSRTAVVTSLQPIYTCVGAPLANNCD